MPSTLAVRESRLEEVVCAFCRGRGKDPFDIMSSLSSCCVCGGRGTVIAPDPHTRCAHCRGTGAIKTLTCTVCRGKGVVPAIGEPKTVCPDCGGTGDDGSAPAMACLWCRGKGWLPQRPPERKGEWA
jgi:DnaJ-class molecular chaperone